MGAKRGNIEAPLQASGAQRGEELVLIVEPLVLPDGIRPRYASALLMQADETKQRLHVLCT